MIDTFYANVNIYLSFFAPGFFILGTVLLLSQIIDSFAFIIQFIAIAANFFRKEV